MSTWMWCGWVGAARCRRDEAPAGWVALQLLTLLGRRSLRPTLRAPPRRGAFAVGSAGCGAFALWSL
eukprot:861542-Prorocentrum_minimum.AAC.1